MSLPKAMPGDSSCVLGLRVTRTRGHGHSCNWLPCKEPSIELFYCMTAHKMQRAEGSPRSWSSWGMGGW